MIKRIVIIPTTIIQRGPNGINHIENCREKFECDRFAEELSNQTNLPCMVIEEESYQPLEADIIICWYKSLIKILNDSNNQSDIAARCILVDFPKPKPSIEETHRLQLAGLIPPRSYSLWLAHKNPSTKLGTNTELLGLKKFESFFATKASIQEEESSKNYVWYFSHSNYTFIQFMGEYIRCLIEQA